MAKLRKISIYVDVEDLALLEQAAERRGIPQPEILREAIHLAAMSNRAWEEELEWPMVDGKEL